MEITAAEINRHHDLARQHATEAIQHAVEAGRLLLQVKTQLLHGEWQAWLHENTTVSLRQSRRYMAAAQNKVPIRHGKTDTVSLLSEPGVRAREVTKGAPWVQLVLPDLQGDLL